MFIFVWKTWNVWMRNFISSRLVCRMIYCYGVGTHSPERWGKKIQICNGVGFDVVWLGEMIRTWLSFHDSFHPHNDVGSIADELCCIYSPAVVSSAQPIKSVRWIVKEQKKQDKLFYYWSPLELKLEWTWIFLPVGITLNFNWFTLANIRPVSIETLSVLLW